jgi:hypothetical protein
MDYAHSGFYFFHYFILKYLHKTSWFCIVSVFLEMFI